METRLPNVERGAVAEVPAQPRHSAGDPIPPKCQVIEVHVAELNQLFNAIDPAPFRQRDLDPDAEDFIVGWAREIPDDAPLALVVRLDRPAGLPEEPAILRDAIREFFGQRAQVSRLPRKGCVVTRSVVARSERAGLSSFIPELPILATQVGTQPASRRRPRSPRATRNARRSARTRPARSRE